ncbi:hypothetical protein L2E82_28437 [Cichorium intybus]|uniref:Uncharacterized protein n=1 Tax=Cichorium intybus TaxID=13427 RepID=A0ACB9CVT4_CICIN|nr:hypothetical protein L2E82_28437 [Cichorium intybus]
MPRCMSTDDFNSFVDRIMILRENPRLPIEKFSLSYHRSCHNNNISRCIRAAAKLAAKEVEITLPEPQMVRLFHWDAFEGFNTLVSLKLEGGVVLGVPNGVVLPFVRLKKLYLISVFYSSNEAFTKFISGCPVLEELILERQATRKSDKMSIFNISSPSLKMIEVLFLKDCDGKCNLVILARQLEKIHLIDKMSSDIYVKPTSSVVQAYINTTVKSLVRVFRGVCSVKNLTLARETMECLKKKINTGAVVNLPIFNELITLVVHNCDCYVMDVLLNAMPKLESVTFDEVLACIAHWQPPMEGPQCLHTLRNINISKVIRDPELLLVKYFLDRCVSLETLTIPKGIGQKIVGLPRASPVCHIQFP